MNSRRFSIPLMVVGLVSINGCAPGESRLFDLHLANDPKAQAKARWEAVRGSVKLQLAEEHLKSGRFEDAERALEESLALCPNDAKAFVLATRLRLEQGQLAEAREAITVAAALNEKDPEIPYFAGLVAQRYGDLDAACEQFTTASAAAPQVAEYVLSRAETLVNLNRPVEALELLKSRLGDFDRNVSMRMLAMRICRILGLRGPAIAYAREAVRIGDDAPALVGDLGLTLVWAEQYGDAVTVLAPLIDRSTDKPHVSDGNSPEQSDVPSPSLIKALARAYIETDKGPKAIEVLRPLLKGNADDRSAWTLNARAAILSNQLERADESLGKLAENGNASAETSVMAAYVAFRRGEFVKAKIAAAKAIELDDRLATAHCIAGQAAEALGETDAAIDSYQAALDIDPESATARRRLEALTSHADLINKDSPNVSVAVCSTLDGSVCSACAPEGTVP